VTIGRLDVQVNNQPPAQPPSPSPAQNKGPHQDALEQHYLDRFRLKPW
jgi:hypothetical protein